MMRLAVRLGALLAELRAERRRPDEIREQDRRRPRVRRGRLAGHRSAVYFVYAVQGKQRFGAGRNRHPVGAGDLEHSKFAWGPRAPGAPNDARRRESPGTDSWAKAAHAATSTPALPRSMVCGTG